MQVVASPADLIKVRMQADGQLVSQGIQPRYRGLYGAFKTIIKTEGLRGLWQGVIPNVQRAFLVNMGELACYDHAKRLIIQNHAYDDNIYAHIVASIMSGLSATTLSCPAVVVKTRMMNQNAGKESEVMYRNSLDCLVKTVRFEGVRALWKGFSLHGQGLVHGSLCFGFPMKSFGVSRGSLHSKSSIKSFLSHTYMGKACIWSMAVCVLGFLRKIIGLLRGSLRSESSD